MWLKSYFRFVFIFLVLCSLGSFDLFKYGGALPQGLDNFIEAEGVIRYVNHMVVLLALLGLLLFLVVKSLKVPVMHFSNPLWGLVFLMACSALWQYSLGVEYFQGITKVSVLITVTIVFVMLIPGLVTWSVLLRDMQVLFLICFAVSIFLALFIPSYGVDVEGRGWQGMFNHKNQLGVFCVVAACISLMSYRVVSVAPEINLILSLFLVIASGSYTSVGVIFFIILAFSIPNFVKAWILRAKYIFFMLFLGLNLGVVAISVLGEFSDVDIFGKDISFSGRDRIWVYVIEGMYDSFFGHGLNSIALQNELDPSAFHQATGQLLGSAHNGLMSLYYDLGVPGCALLFFLFVLCLSSLDSSKKSDFGIFIFLMVLLIMNTFESKFFGFNIFFVFFVLFYSYLRQKNFQ